MAKFIFALVTLGIFCLVQSQTFDEEILNKINEKNELAEELKSLKEELGKKKFEFASYLDDETTSLTNAVNSKITTTNEKLKENLEKELEAFEKLQEDNQKTFLKYAENNVFEIYKNITKSAQDNLKTQSWSTRFDKNNGRSTEFTIKTDMLTNTLREIDNIRNSLKGEAEKLIGGFLTDQEKAEKATKVKELEDDFYKLAKQVQAIQFHEEEKQRTDGQSGIKQIRTGRVGARNYHSNTHTGGSFMAIHEHSNNIRTVGMGEFIGVLNGIEFRTRHNDYRLYQAASNDKTYHKTEDIKFPEVPKAVTEKPTVEEQIKEMREWFKAWVEQNSTVRDYKKFFKPVLVYLEGSWIGGKAEDAVDEFDSDRHHIDAKNWLDLQDRVRFTSYSGSKSLLENLAHLPTKIIRFTDDKRPVLAQWNYRILCHQVSKDIPTSFLEPRYDEAAQRRNKRTDEQYLDSRAARFDIEGIDINGKRDQGPMQYNFLDSLMEEIPGKDNYGGNIEAKAMNAPDDTLYTANPLKKDQKLNAAYYHRTFIQKSNSGVVQNQDQRTFSDRVYVAETTQEQIAPSTYKDSQGKRVAKKVSFAVPMEIIYLTPLHSWNPYNIPYARATSGKGTAKEPFNGTSSRVYYNTPSKFFTGDDGDTDPADTAKKGASFIVSPGSEEPEAVHASGTRIHFPPIKGIDKKVRQRYPIMPIHGEGSALWKKLNALEDVMNFDAEEGGTELGTGYNFQTGVSHSTQAGLSGHFHMIQISEDAYGDLIDGTITELDVSTSRSNSHFHEITIALNPQRDQPGENMLYIKACQNQPASNDKVCFDQHEYTLVVVQ